MGAKMARARQIIAVDIAANKLQWAKDFGATDVINASNGDPVETIKELTGGHGVDYSFEAVGTPQTLLQALWSRDLAGVCTLIGVPDPTMKMELPMLQFFGLGGSLRVSWYGDCLPTRDFPLLAEWYAKGELDLDRVVTNVIKLEETEAAFEAMERGETLRSVIRFPDE
jgi:S-(hydroxymethyl)mycothiol dehydrogenase